MIVYKHTVLTISGTRGIIWNDCETLDIIPAWLIERENGTYTHDYILTVINTESFPNAPQTPPWRSIGKSRP